MTMREIKFCGKRLDTGEWIYGALVKEYDGWSICDWSMPDYGRYDVDSATVGQYTGLKDKNGVEIYEGDIVKYVDGEYSFTAVVEWGDWGWYMRGIEPNDNFNFDDTEADEVEVIGNAHDNPELQE